MPMPYYVSPEQMMKDKAASIMPPMPATKISGLLAAYISLRNRYSNPTSSSVEKRNPMIICFDMAYKERLPKQPFHGTFGRPWWPAL